MRPHKLFKRREDDLYIDLPITFTQAALGAEIDVPTLGKPVKYRFPEGTQPGQVFCVRGEGVPRLRGSGKGDLYVTAVVEIPKKLTRKAEEPAARVRRKRLRESVRKEKILLRPRKGRVLVKRKSKAGSSEKSRRPFLM